MYENVTKLTYDIAKNQFDMEKEFSNEKYIDYYLNICQLVWDCHWAKPTPEQIEQYLEDGEFLAGTESVICPIHDKDMRKHLFLSAQAKQLQYDMLSGRGALLRGEDEKFNDCPDTIGRLKLLGLYQKNMLTE